MGDTATALLRMIMDAYPFNGGGNCTKAAVFHSHMLNTFKPAFDLLVVDQVQAHVITEPDDETPLTDVVTPAPATEEE